MSEDNDFDMDAGVADIAESMGFSTDGDDDIDDNTDTGTDDELQEQETETTKEIKDDAKEPEVTTKNAPSSWAKEQHDNWAKIPKEAQEYVELREKQMLDGIEQYKQGHQQALEMQRVIEPFRGSLQKHGVSETQAIQNLFTHHIALTEGTTEARQAAFVALGQNLGLIPNEGQPPVDQRTQELQQRLERIERQEQQRAQQAQAQSYSKIEQEVNAFASDPKNEYFDEVADDVVTLLKTGIDLQSAYEKAVWANPITRAKELSKSVAEQTKALSAKSQQQAKAAKKATSSNVRPLNSSKASNDPAQSWDDTMAETLAKIKNG
jgi:hypothetical protein